MYQRFWASSNFLLLFLDNLKLIPFDFRRLAEDEDEELSLLFLQHALVLQLQCSLNPHATSVATSVLSKHSLGLAALVLLMVLCSMGLGSVVGVEVVLGVGSPGMLCWLCISDLFVCGLTWSFSQASIIVVFSMLC